MSRADGFDRMDVSTSLPADPKFRLLARRHPQLVAVGLAAYVGLLAESWGEGARLTLEEAWPAVLPFDDAAARALAEVRLVDDEGRIPVKAWGEWFGAAFERRALGRARHRRYNATRPTRRDVSPVPVDNGSTTPPLKETGRQTVRPSGSQSHSRDDVVTTTDLTLGLPGDTA